MQKANQKKALWPRIWQARYIYLLILPYFVWLAIFHYAPMYGLLLAFKKYSAKLGILRSEWVGLANFKRIFVTPLAKKAILNTFVISFNRILFEFPMPIILAILITEMRGKRLKKFYQTVYTFPHFLSWIVVATILTNLLASGGAINTQLAKMGMQKINFLGDSRIFKPLLYITSNWKGMGWGAIIYMAAITGIDPTLYDAAELDGANRWQRIWYVTLAGIRSTVSIMLILSIGGIMDAGFDQIFNMRNPVVSGDVQILDTYIYDITFDAVPNYGFSTAVGLFKSVINFALLLTANILSSYLSGGENQLIGTAGSAKKRKGKDRKFAK